MNVKKKKKKKKNNKHFDFWTTFAYFSTLYSRLRILCSISWISSLFFPNVTRNLILILYFVKTSRFILTVQKSYFHNY